MEPTIKDNGAMKFTRTQWVVLALVVAGILTLTLISRRGKPVEVVVVTQGPLVQSVVTTGRIASVARNDIASQSTARIEAILVREGDSVQARQVLVRLRDDEATANLAQAKAAVSEARARMRQLATVQEPVSAQQLEQARAADTQAARELDRARDLLKQGFVSQSRVDDAQRAATASAAAVRAASAQAAGNESSGAEHAMAQSRLEQALAAEKAAATRLDQLSLRAPAAGTITSRAADPGDTAQAGRAILTLVSGDETRIHASVDEKNLGYLKLGQGARATADAYPQRPFDATLTFIAPAVDAQRGTVDLKLRVDKATDTLRPDMTVSVEIITAQEPQALRLPSDAVRRDATGLAYALVNRDGRAEKVALTLGLQGVGTTQVVTGLAAGDRIITPSTAADAGDRVREQRQR
ncbi:MAG: efflux RND transporter periplasmic adaptor subunit [Aquabacterium sp.]|nr:efflux RND transporter periplasmic adaptor subunit [Aquabacterium sp.]